MQAAAAVFREEVGCLPPQGVPSEGANVLMEDDDMVSSTTTWVGLIASGEAEERGEGEPCCLALHDVAGSMAVTADRGRGAAAAPVSCACGTK